MFETKLTPQHHWLTILPVIIILVIVGFTLATSVRNGIQPREGFFDLFMRLDPRDVAEEDSFTPAIVMIDRESVERVGQWPWPRTVIAELVDSIRAAGATSVIVTLPVEGPDPLSPEVVGRYWFNRSGDEAGAIADAVSRLPSNDVTFARSLSRLPTAVALGQDTYTSLGSGEGWTRTEIPADGWLAVAAGDGTQTDFLALPIASPQGQLAANIEANATPSVSALPADGDGVVRRVPLSWSAYGRPLPSTALAPFTLGDEQVTALPHRSLVRTSGRTISRMIVRDHEIILDRQNTAALYFPSDTGLQSVAAWRILSGGETWSSALEGNTVFIGENVTGNSSVETARGEMSRAQVLALMADQIAAGDTVVRPEWAGFLEVALALVLGVAATFLVLVVPGVYAAGFTAVMSILTFVGTWLFFSRTNLLIDPSPVIFAMIGGQLGVVISRLAGAVLRDDAVRGAFHGSLPPSSMSKLQRGRASHLLDGVHRQVTVLSCAVRLPDRMLDDYKDEPEQYMAYLAQTNDRLRQTILNMGGAVDYGDDGRLLGYWNVPEEDPDHAEKACSCALAMIEEVNQLAHDTEMAQSVRPARLIGRGMSAAYDQGRLEIGIASETGYAGPVGRGNRNRYTAIGPAVSFANVLRNRSRVYGPAVICDETVFTALRHQFAFLDLDVVKVNDDPQPRPVYGLVGNPFLKASKSFRVMSDTQRALVIAWREGSISASEAYLKQLEEIPGAHQAYIDLFRKRIDRVRRERTSDDEMAEQWDGTEQIYI